MDSVTYTYVRIGYSNSGYPLLFTSQLPPSNSHGICARECCNLRRNKSVKLIFLCCYLTVLVYTKTTTVPCKCKLTVPRSSIRETRFSILDSRKLRGSRLESSFETFESFREIFETIFETLEWRKQRSFRVINFSRVSFCLFYTAFILSYCWFQSFFAFVRNSSKACKCLHWYCIYLSVSG